jgi:hypothetical protein
VAGGVIGEVGFAGVGGIKAVDPCLTLRVGGCEVCKLLAGKGLEVYIFFGAAGARLARIFAVERPGTGGGAAAKWSGVFFW